MAVELICQDLSIDSCKTNISQGESFRVVNMLTDQDGNPIVGGIANAISVVGNAGEILSSALAYHGGGGMWRFTFTMPVNAPIGGYRIFWTTTAGAVVAIAKLPFWVEDP